MNSWSLARRAISMLVLGLLACDEGAADPVDDDEDTSVEPPDDMRAAGAPGCRVVPPPAGPADDAFEDAIACAVAHDYVPVFVTPGRYALTRTIDVLEKVSLVGMPTSSYGVNGPGMNEAPPLYPMPELRFSENTYHGVELADRASISGFAISFVSDSDAPLPAGPSPDACAVRVRGVGTSVTAMRIENPRTGICAEDDFNAGRLYVASAFIIDPVIGVYIGQTRDVSHLENVHVWKPSLAITEGSRGFVLGSNDFLLMKGLSAWAMETSMELRTVGPSGTTGSISNFASDFGLTALSIRGGQHRVTFSGGVWLSQIQNVITDDTASGSLVLTGLHLQSNAGAGLLLRSPSLDVTVSASHFAKHFPDQPTWTGSALQVEGVRLLTVTGNTFDLNGHGVYFASPPTRAAITGNTFLIANPSGRTVISPVDLAGSVTTSGNSP